MSWTPLPTGVEDRLQLADGVLEDPDPIHDPLDDVGLDRAGRVEVEDRQLLLGLADPVDAADALLDLHRVPRQVVVDDGRAELEVETLAGHPRREQDVVRARRGRRP